jgi:hypothetical protein
MRHSERVAGRTEYVYLIATPWLPGRVKVGRTLKPSERVRQARTWLPGAYLVACMPCSDACETERRMHDALFEVRLGGEWFAIAESDAIALLEEHA